MDKLIERLRQYSQSLVAYKLGADFADAVNDAADTVERLKKENRTLRNELCLLCGRYQFAYKGACNGCRWHKRG